MSFKPAQITSLERVASRRNVMRSAAWTTAAVTVVVATPNIAAASTTPPQGSAVQVGVTRHGNDLVVNAGGLKAGAQTLTGVTATVTLTFAPAGPMVTGRSVAQPWAVSPPSASLTFSLATLGANAAQDFRPTIELSDANFDSVTVTVSYTWTGNTTGVSTSATFLKANSRG